MNTENYYIETVFAGKTMKLAVKEYVPNNLKAMLFILHGMTEHMGRYEDFATTLSDVGIGVIGFDLPGHGASTSFGNFASFGDGNWELLVEYIPTFIRLVNEKYNCPVYVMGFSLGSFLLREYLSTGPTLIAGSIIAGTGVQPNIVLRGLECIVQNEVKKVGFDNGSTFIDNLSFGQYNKNIKDVKTEYDWLCFDSESILEYSNDELCKKHISSGLFLNLLRSMRRTNNPKLYKNWNPKLKTLIISGLADPVGSDGRGPQCIYEQLVHYGVENVKIEMLPGRHDIFHEISNGTQAKVADIIIEFILNQD